MWYLHLRFTSTIVFADFDEGQRDSVCQCHLVLQGARTHICPPTQNLDISLWLPRFQMHQNLKRFSRGLRVKWKECSKCEKNVIQSYLKMSKKVKVVSKVANATHAVANVDDYSGSARLLAATTLRFNLNFISFVGSFSFSFLKCGKSFVGIEIKISRNKLENFLFE